MTKHTKKAGREKMPKALVGWVHPVAFTPLVGTLGYLTASTSPTLWKRRTSMYDIPAALIPLPRKLRRGEEVVAVIRKRKGRTKR